MDAVSWIWSLDECTVAPSGVYQMQQCCGGSWVAVMPQPSVTGRLEGESVPFLQEIQWTCRSVLAPSQKSGTPLQYLGEAAGFVSPGLVKYVILSERFKCLCLFLRAIQWFYSRCRLSRHREGIMLKCFHVAQLFSAAVQYSVKRAWYLHYSH